MNGLAVFWIDGRPWTVNGQRQMHHLEIARRITKWRNAAREACRDLPKLCPPISVSVTPYLRHGYVQDVGACYPAVKAAIDGMVDAGLLPDDTPEFVAQIILNAPHLHQVEDKTLFEVRELSE